MIAMLKLSPEGALSGRIRSCPLSVFPVLKLPHCPPRPRLQEIPPTANTQSPFLQVSVQRADQIL